jgi:hypothetical protein
MNSLLSLNKNCSIFGFSAIRHYKTWSLYVTKLARNPASADFHYFSGTKRNTVQATFVLGLYLNCPVALNVNGGLCEHNVNL